MNRPEQALQKSVRAFLDLALPKDAFVTAFPAGGGGGLRGAILHGMGLVAGVPDLFILYQGKIIFIELKSAKGKLQPAQNATIERLLKAGALVFICRSIEEVAADLSESGIPLRTKGEWLPRKVQNRSAA